MTNLPFGFGGSSDDESGPGDDGKPVPPFGFGPGGLGGLGGPGGQNFDLSNLGDMLSRLGQMMSDAGASSGPVNYPMVRKLVGQALGSQHPASEVDRTLAAEALRLAELWLDPATSFPGAIRTMTAWSPAQWVESTLPAWEQLCTPVADRVSTSWTAALPEDLRAQLGPMLGMMRNLGSASFSTQLAQGLAHFSKEVLTSTDVGVPLGPEGTGALLPLAVASLASELSIDADQVRLYLAAREAAHLRLYAAAPWLRPRVVELVTAYAAGISVDFSEMESLAERFNPQDPASMQELMSGEFAQMLEPKITPGQHATREDLETLLTLIEGWVDTVVSDAVGERLPTAGALREAMRRRRASGGPAEQTFATLVGLEMRPVRLRAASELWQTIGEIRGTDGRDALWGAQQTLPTIKDLDDPTGFANRDRAFTELMAGLDLEVDAESTDDPQTPGEADSTGTTAGTTDSNPDDPDNEREHTGGPEDSPQPPKS